MCIPQTTRALRPITQIVLSIRAARPTRQYFKFRSTGTDMVGLTDRSVIARPIREQSALQPFHTVIASSYVYVSSESRHHWYNSNRPGVLAGPFAITEGCPRSQTKWRNCYELRHTINIREQTDRQNLKMKHQKLQKIAPESNLRRGCMDHMAYSQKKKEDPSSRAIRNLLLDLGGKSRVWARAGRIPREISKLLNVTKSGPGSAS